MRAAMRAVACAREGSGGKCRASRGASRRGVRVHVAATRSRVRAVPRDDVREGERGPCYAGSPRGGRRASLLCAVAGLYMSRVDRVDAVLYVVNAAIVVAVVLLTAATVLR